MSTLYGGAGWKFGSVAGGQLRVVAQRLRVVQGCQSPTHSLVLLLLA